MSRMIDPSTPIEDLSPEDRAWLAERDGLSARLGATVPAPVTPSLLSADMLKLDTFLRVEFPDDWRDGESAVDLAIRLLSIPVTDDTYDEMKVADLLELAKSREGLEMPAKATKGPLIEALRSWDAANPE